LRHLGLPGRDDDGHGRPRPARRSGGARRRGRRPRRRRGSPQVARGLRAGARDRTLLVGRHRAPPRRDLRARGGTRPGGRRGALKLPAPPKAWPRAPFGLPVRAPVVALVGTVFAHRVFDLVPVLLLIVYVLLTAKIPHWAITSLAVFVAIGVGLFAFALANARRHHRGVDLEMLGPVRRLVAMGRQGLG